MTLTARLSLFFLGALATVLVTFSAVLYAIADFHLRRQLDDRLHAAALHVAAAAEIKSDGLEWEPKGRPHALSSNSFGDDLHWVLATDAGQVVDCSPQPGAPELMAEADRGFQTGHRNPRRVEYGDRAWQATRLRLESPVPLQSASKKRRYAALVLTVAVPLDSVSATLHALAATLAALVFVTLVAALVTGRTVCRRVLAPVTRMADAARSMGAAELTDRLPSGAAADELADLAAAFNGLLDRLGEAFERERRFAGEASHQLRTPLTALIGQVEVALRRDRAPDEYRRALGSVLDQAGRLRRVVEALLFLARSDADARLPGLERVDLAVWVPARLHVWASGPRGSDLKFEVPLTETPALIHTDLFGELLDALLDNAFKYSAPDTPVAVLVGSDSRGVQVQVEDRGCGIAPADLPHLFRPFFRSEQARTRGVPGIGLGLAVAARIAAALGGSIDAVSEGGRGCRITVRLPAAFVRPVTLDTSTGATDARVVALSTAASQ